MRIRAITLIAAVALFAGNLSLAEAQNAQDARASRVSPGADLTPRTRLTGHVPSWVNRQTDSAVAADSTPVVLTFLLARTAPLQAAFDQMAADQQNPSSARFQRWLTPEQIGEQYGPTLAEIASVSQWIRSQGLQVTSVSPSRTFIQATGLVSSASTAFSVTFQVFDVEGEPRVAVTTEPSIPSAFASIILSVEGLSATPFQSFHTVHEVEAVPGRDTVHPLSTSPQGVHYLFPGDFARIYDVAATTGAGYDGTGVKVAIAGQSRITGSDITELEGMAGLPAKMATTILVPTSSDPGLVRGDEDESTLDVARVLTSAPGVQADLVVASAAAGGVSTAIQYSINTLVDPILSISYGACEAAASASSVQFYNLLFEQAAAEGISTFVSSGDSAAAGCARSFSTPTGSETLGMGNYLCSSSYVTCVGGTEFADAGASPNFWSPTNSSTYVSALGYIPEGAWNEPAVSGSNGSVTYQIAGSGSGPSAYIAKPTWQSGTGVPADGARDIPDIAFSAANHDGYFACLAYLGAGADCSKGGGVVFSGTSATAPGMAAVAALLNQRLGSSQGNLNPLLYRLAGVHPEAFHDATPASSGVGGCSTATPSLCNNSVAGHAALSGGLAGYSLQTGYDLVTGLGSLDVTNFLNAAAGKTIAAATITVSASATSVAIGQSVTFTASVETTGGPAPTGTVQFFSNATALTGPLTVADIVVSPALTFSATGTDAITAVYSGDVNYTTSISPAVSLDVTTLPAAVTVVSATPATISVGQTTVYSATVTAAATPGTVPTGTIQFAVNGTPVAMPQALKAGSASLSVLPSTAGSYLLTAAYSGDVSNGPSTSSPVTVVVEAMPTATVLSLSSTLLNAGETTVLSAAVSSGSKAGGTVQFFAGSAALGMAPVAGGTASIVSVFPVAGSYAITAVYSGDATFASSTSPVTTLTVNAAASLSGLSVTVDPASATLSSASGNTTTGTVTLTTEDSFTGAVTIVCTVTATSGNPQTPPTCSLSTNPVVFTSARTATATISLSTEVPKAKESAGPTARLTPGRSGSGIALAALCILFPFARRRRTLALLPVLLAGIMLPLTGCGSTVTAVTNTGGGGGGSTAPTSTGTTAGTYTVTVLAASGTITAMTGLTLTVK